MLASIDPRGRRVLVIGDSLTHRGSDSAPDGVTVTESAARSSTPGDLFASHLLAMGAAAARINGRVSRGAYNLFTGANGEDGRQVLATETAWRPDLVFVVLGTNDLGLADRPLTNAYAVLRDAFPGAQVIAVGPPYFARSEDARESAAVYAILARTFGPANVIDWRPGTLAMPRTPDGVHFTAAGAKGAAVALAAAVMARRPVAIAPAGSALGPAVFTMIVLGALGVGGLVLLRRPRPRRRR